jgi:uncharacterized delta-60 repeat protein
MDAATVGRLMLAFALCLAAPAQAAPLVPDPSFSGDGRATIHLAGHDLIAFAVAIAPDGKIVVAGEALSKADHGRPAVAVARLLSNGAPDATFGGDGLVVTQAATLALSASDPRSGATGVVVLPDRRIVIGGYARSRVGASDRAGFLLARYTESGALDHSFGEGDGIAVAPFDDNAFGNDVALGPGGSLVMVGQATVGSEASWGVARFTAAGVPDAGFSDDGIDIVDVVPGEHDVPNAVAVQGDGNIVTAGYVMTEDAHPSVALTRHDDEGWLDPQFGADGRVVADPVDEAFAFAVAIQTDGRIVVGGGSDDLGSMVARFEASGAPDTAFGNGGVVTTPDELSRFEGLALGADGTIFAAGWRQDQPFSPISKMTAGRFLAGGQADGVFPISFGTDTEAYGTAIQADGRLVLAGHSYTPNAAQEWDLAVLRVVEGSDSSGGDPAPALPGSTPVAGQCSVLTACTPPAPTSVVVPRITMSVKNRPNGVVVLSFAVPARGVLKVSATATTTRPTRRLTFGKARRSVRPGIVKIRLKPTRAAKRLLARNKRLKVKIRAVFTPADGGKATVMTKRRVVTAMR